MKGGQESERETQTAKVSGVQAGFSGESSPRPGQSMPRAHHPESVGLLVFWGTGYRAQSFEGLEFFSFNIV